jgi:hypothetical protein
MINAKWCEIVMGILVIVFALWNVPVSKWILVAIGIILIVHSFMCKMCCCSCEMPSQPEKKKRK